MLLLQCENRSQCLSNWAKTTDAHHQLSLTLNFNFQSKSNTSNYWKRNRNSLRVEAVGKECGCVRNLTYTTNGSPVVHGTRPRLDIKLLIICFRAFQTSRVQNCRSSIIFQFQNLLSFESSIDSVDFVQIDLLLASCGALLRELFTIVIMGTQQKLHEL